MRVSTRPRRRGAALAAALAAVLAGAWTASGSDRGLPGRGDRAHPFALEDVNPRSASHGRTVSLAELASGGGAVLKFTASWCPYCRSELGELPRLLREAGVPVVLVAADEHGGPAAILALAERETVTAPILFVPREESRAMNRHYAHDVLPATYLIDRERRVALAHEGTLRAADVLHAIGELLARE